MQKKKKFFVVASKKQMLYSCDPAPTINPLQWALINHQALFTLLAYFRFIILTQYKQQRIELKSESIRAGQLE